MPAHHNLEAYLDAYMHAAGLFGAKGTPLFRAADLHGGALTGTADAPHRRLAHDPPARRETLFQNLLLFDKLSLKVIVRRATQRWRTRKVEYFRPKRFRAKCAASIEAD